MELKKINKKKIEVFKEENYFPEIISRKYSVVRTPLQALGQDSKSLAIIKKENSEENILSIIHVWIMDLNEYLNLKTRMNANQIKQTALFILDDFYYFKISEINLLFSRIKKGFYGSFYESLDGAKILGYFDKYDKERMQAVDDDNYYNHLDKKCLT